jgi:hypothetical protein
MGTAMPAIGIKRGGVTNYFLFSILNPRSETEYNLSKNSKEIDKF